MDQYDNPCAHYSLVVRDGRVVAGARVMSTASMWGSHTYMLRDAYRGQIDQIPPRILDAEIASEEVWECTRLVTSASITSASDRAECLSLVVGGLIDIAANHGALGLVTLTRPSLLRALRQLGFSVSQCSEAYLSEADGRRYAVLQMPVTTSSQVIAAE